MTGAILTGAILTGAILTGVPVEVGRDEAREAAARELTKTIYHQDDPSWFELVYEWLSQTIEDLFDRAAAIAPGGYPGLIALAVVLVLAVIAIRLRVGRLAGTRTGGRELFDGRGTSAAQHRQAADRYAGSGAWAEAVRERLRAVIRDLEERALIDVRPGRTADEAAYAGGAALPSCAAGLRDAAWIFDDVWYGGRAATAAMDATLRAVDAAVRVARPSVAGVVATGTRA